MKTRPPAPDTCPCGSGALYAACCGRWHAGPLHLQAPSAEALMRSRYSAYVRGLTAYLLDTWHTSTRPSSLGKESGAAEPTDADTSPRTDHRVPLLTPSTQWLGLQVKQHRSTGPHRAEVEFVARSKWGGRAHRLHENSRFVFEAGRWYYVDGDLL